MSFQPGDICITGVEHTAQCYIILELPNAEGHHLALDLKTRKICLVRGGLHKIGEVSPGLGLDGVKALVFQKIAPPALDSAEYVLGKARAEYEVLHGDPDARPRWQILAAATPGTPLVVHLASGTESVMFHNVLTRGHRFVFVAADPSGKLLRYTLDCLCLGSADHVG
jgi:hypothetical protein